MFKSKNNNLNLGLDEKMNEFKRNTEKQLRTEMEIEIKSNLNNF